MPYILYVCNKDTKGRVKAYGEAHATKESAEFHRKNLRAYYRSHPHDLKATRLVKIERGVKWGMSSNEIMKKYFSKEK